jgi:competence protein ComEA
MDFSSEGTVNEIEDDFKKEKKFNFNFKNIEEFFLRNKFVLGTFLLGLILIGLGVFLYKDRSLGGKAKIEILESSTEAQNAEKTLVVEIAGAVIKPGVYELKAGSRVEDLLVKAGGFSENADRVWVERYVNRATSLTDGQKVYIGSVDEQTNVLSANNSGNNQSASTVQGSGESTLININTASFQELDSLPGIGQVYATNIIEQRPYSTIEELLNRGVLKKNVYEKIKNQISAY